MQLNKLFVSITRILDSSMGFHVFWISQHTSWKSFTLAIVKYGCGYYRLYNANIFFILICSLGCLVMCKIPFNIIVAILAFTVGFAYFVLSLVPNLPPPNGFLVHWQNHKDFWAEGLDLSIPQNHPTPMSQTVPILSLPHPSAWHPSPPNQTVSTSYYTSPVNTNTTDYSKFQHNLVQKEPKTRAFVIY